MTQPRWTRLTAGVMAILVALGPAACRNPAQSTLPPTAIPKDGMALPPLPKGDVYADETVVPAGTPIEPGDTLEIVVRRGAGEEVYTSVVAQDGRVRAGFLDVLVTGLTAPQAEQEIQEKLAPYMRDPRVQIQLKKKLLKVKRVFVFGDVKEPGMYPLARNMTVLQAVASAKNYNETALL
ncbi:MAG: polysaccharide biosynthesis/export family protein, partial [Nitrospirales bacterium]